MLPGLWEGVIGASMRRPGDYLTPMYRRCNIAALVVSVGDCEGIDRTSVDRPQIFSSEVSLSVEGVVLEISRTGHPTGQPLGVSQRSLGDQATLN